MSEFRLSFPACLVAGKNRLAAEDLSMLRNVTFPNGIRSFDDVVTLLALQNSCPEKCEEWDAFFIEALTRFIVHYSYPQGMLDEINALWLIRTLSTDGVVNSPLELELLLNVIDVSASVPPALAAFALDQLLLAMTDGIGAYRRARPIDRRGITRHDLDYVKRILRATPATGRLPLSPLTVTVLKRIDAATSAGSNHPAWRDLMNAIEIREEDSRAASRWLRISDDMLKAESAA